MTGKQKVTEATPLCLLKSRLFPRCKRTIIATLADELNVIKGINSKCLNILYAQE